MATTTHFFLVARCSANTSTQCWDLNSRMNRGSHNSLATPKSLQHRISALLLHASVAVGMPEGSKYSCSPLAIATNLDSNEAFETVLLTRAARYSPSEAYQRVLPADYFGPDVCFTTRCETPSSWAERLVQYPAVLDLREIDQPI